jgi:hypothetical protein
MSGTCTVVVSTLEGELDLQTPCHIHFTYELKYWPTYLCTSVSVHEITSTTFGPPNEARGERACDPRTQAILHRLLECRHKLMFDC